MLLAVSTLFVPQVAAAGPVATDPPIATNEFFPETANITDCLGALERPGCGSESRGGWGQTLTLLALVGGLTVVFGSIARGVRKNRSTE